MASALGCKEDLGEQPRLAVQFVSWLVRTLRNTGAPGGENN